MNFDFSDELKQLRDEARRFLTDRCPPAVPRAILEGPEPFDRDLWKAMAEMGWTGAAIPETYGGVGLGRLAVCVLAQELGRAVAPVPFASSVYLATEAIMLFGSEAPVVVRLPFILLFAVSQALMFRIGCVVADRRAGFWAVVAWWW